MRKSKYLSSLSSDQRNELQQRLYNRQNKACFICEKKIDLHLHEGALEIDHIDPLVTQGKDADQNFALTHTSCNRKKGPLNLQVAKRIVKFESLQKMQSTKEKGD